MKVLVLYDSTSENVLCQVREWLEAEGCQVAAFEVDASSERKKGEAITEMLSECEGVILLFGPNLSATDVQATLLAAKVKGIKIVGIRLPGKSVPDQSIDAFEKFAFALIPLDRSKVIAATCNEKPEWTDEEGAPREEPDTDRYKCKKQKSDAAA